MIVLFFKLNQKIDVEKLFLKLADCIVEFLISITRKIVVIFLLIPNLSWLHRTFRLIIHVFFRATRHLEGAAKTSLKFV